MYATVRDSVGVDASFPLYHTSLLMSLTPCLSPNRLVFCFDFLLVALHYPFSQAAPMLRAASKL